MPNNTPSFTPSVLRRRRALKLCAAALSAPAWVGAVALLTAKTSRVGAASAADTGLNLPAAELTATHSSGQGHGTYALDLSQYQREDGLLTTFRQKNSEVADPYFGLYSLELARRAGLDVRETAQRALAWGVADQKRDGRFERYCGKAGALRMCGNADSDDATLARWLQLIAFNAPRPWSDRVTSSFERADQALRALRMRNGIYSVFPHDTPGYKGYALFKDNVEVLNALESLSSPGVLKEENAQRWQARFKADANALRKAMARHFGSGPESFEVLALGAVYRKQMFYPHHVAAPFAWAEGYVQAPRETVRNYWQRWLQQHQENWDTFAKKDYPWGLLALGAVHAGLPHVGRRWLDQVAEQRQAHVRWNLLEETCAQAIEFRLAIV